MSQASRALTFTVNAMLHVFILSTFLVILYKFVITNMETAAIHSQLRKELNGTLPEMFTQMDASSGNILKHVLLGLKSDGMLSKLSHSYSKPDTATMYYNNWLLGTSYLVCGGMLLLIFAVLVMTWVCGIDIHFKAILTENVVLFLLIGLIELAFFLKIALNYIPAPPSYINQSLIDALKDEFKSPA